MQKISTLDTPSVAEIVTTQEQNYIRGNTQLSKYVNHSMYETLEKTEAYVHSVHTSGLYDAQGNEKPFFNICTSAVNIWYRATDIDRSFIKIRPTPGNELNALLATAFLQDWMRRERFGVFLNKWGRILAKNGSAVVKFVESEGQLDIIAVPWATIICDPVDFYSNPQNEIIELTEGQLRQRVDTHGYDEVMVDELIATKKARETVGKKKKDNRNDFIKLYESHLLAPLSLITDDEKDSKTYVQQMHVFSMVAGSKKDDDKEFTLFRGREEKSPYMLTHLIEEDGRTLSIGSVENLFEAQWMQNDSAKMIRDQLILASKQFYQTADQQFLGTNVVTDLENGHVFVHGMGKPMTQVNNGSHDISQIANNQATWKQLGNEINGISDAMLGMSPKSGTAWRQTEAVLQESHSLFELMVENKGLAIIDMMTERILPFIKKYKLNNSDAIVAELSARDIKQIDQKYLKAKANEIHNAKVKHALLNGKLFTPDTQGDAELQELEKNILEQGNVRTFSPSDVSDKTWKEQFKDLEWDVEVDVTGEAKNVQQAMTTLNTALQVVANPEYSQNENAKKIVGRILEMTGAMSSLEVADMSATIGEQAVPTQAPMGQPA